MQPVADAEGQRYLLLDPAGERWLVRDLQTGRRRHLPAAELTRVDGESPLVAAADVLPDSTRAELPPVPGERAVGLLALLAMRGPTAVRDLLSLTDLCESDLHGLLGELTVGGLLAETTVAGERGYELGAEVASTLETLGGD